MTMTSADHAMPANPTSHRVWKALFGNSPLLRCRYELCPLNWPLSVFVTISRSWCEPVTDGHAVAVDLQLVGALAMALGDTVLSSPVIHPIPDHGGKQAGLSVKWRPCQEAALLGRGAWQPGVESRGAVNRDQRYHAAVY